LKRKAARTKVYVGRNGARVQNGRERSQDRRKRFTHKIKIPAALSLQKRGDKDGQPPTSLGSAIYEVWFGGLLSWRRRGQASR
jgi:hypothetical protein